MNQPTPGHMLLKMVGTLLYSVLAIIGILIFWTLKMIGLAIWKVSDFFLIKLTTK